MRILIVDDWDFRHDLVRSAFKGHDVEFTSRMGPGTVTDEDLATHDVVFLDHDMCTAPENEPCPQPAAPGFRGRNMLNSGCGCPTGQDLAERMVQTLQHRTLKCIIHTQNDLGGPRMETILKNAGFQVSVTPANTWGMCLQSTLHHIWGIELK